MGLLKVLGIGLATVASLGAIGGITAAVVNKQSSDVTLNTVNDKKEDHLENKEEASNDNKEVLNKEKTQNDQASSAETNQNAVEKQNTSLLADEKYPEKVYGSVDEINKEKFPECTKNKAQSRSLQSAEQERGSTTSSYSYCGVA